MQNKDDIREYIRKNYGAVAEKGQGGCCNGGCSCDDSPADLNLTSTALGYTEAELSDIPGGANMGLGCGNPVALAAIGEGDTVLDLGSGGGLDCFLARKRAGETGHVIGVDMTPEMIVAARRNAEKSGYSNVEFRLGEIEHLPVADATVDVIISNCVINLSVDKEQVFKEAYRVLKPGGRLAVSDIVATAPIPQNIREDLQLIAGCVAGAVSAEDIRAMLLKAGFTDIRISPKDNSADIVHSWDPGRNPEDFIASYIFEARKAGI